ncbi:AAA family ATPase [Candidatus Finniella inopinata]|uniref:ATPase n=1 Tax=Candidatus Finniella inopinata TaxID=1696036 RepID=A0A4Q7DMR8_9PROT|nr:ATP-binding protein [Candidatus Finniella inopinata]RZI46116.1 ATPase [Candidatus Finniella inopinata]
MTTFVGRKQELTKFKDLAQKRQASLVVIKGRRRIGKSRLAEEFAKNKTFLSFTGLTPEAGMTAQTQRDAFAVRLAQHFKLPPLTFTDWTDAFYNLSFHLNDQPTVILFDEISWMGAKDSTFIPKLKSWWDLDVQNRANITLVFCGSVSTWIEDNILKSTAFFGRISLILELAPLSLSESANLLRLRGIKGSENELYKILAVTAGIPWCLEQILPHYSADQNIHKLCFEKGGLLTHEFDRIFHDLFSQKGDIYKNILLNLRNGMQTLHSIRQAVNYSKSGTLSTLMEHLIISGFVTKHAQWVLKTGAEKRQSLYRLNDPYTRFFLKYIEPNMTKINKGSYAEVEMTQLPGYETMLSFQMECLLLQNRSALLKAMAINPADCVFDNPYFQLQSSKHKGCQVDYLIQTRTNNIYVCEFKFRRKELGFDIIEDVQNKINRINLPRGYAAVPVLFHIGGVSDKVIDQQYFYRIIDLADFLET